MNTYLVLQILKSSLNGPTHKGVRYTRIPYTQHHSTITPETYILFARLVTLSKFPTESQEVNPCAPMPTHLGDLPTQKTLDIIPERTPNPLLPLALFKVQIVSSKIHVIMCSEAPTAYFLLKYLDTPDIVELHGSHRLEPQPSGVAEIILVAIALALRAQRDRRKHRVGVMGTGHRRRFALSLLLPTLSLGPFLLC